MLTLIETYLFIGMVLCGLISVGRHLAPSMSQELYAVGLTNWAINLITCVFWPVILIKGLLSEGGE